jgi:hypothetical protein
MTAAKTWARAERVDTKLSKQQPSTPRITAEAFQELAWQGVPFVAQLGWRIERFAAGDIAVRLPCSELLLRPGGRSAARRSWRWPTSRSMAWCCR